MREQNKIIVFATIICFACSLLLAGVYSALYKRIEQNKKDDIKKKVLSVFGEKIYDKNGKQILTQKEINKIFDEKVKGFVLDSDGKLCKRKFDSLTKEELNERYGDAKLKKFYPFFIYKGSEGKELYAIHISGRGLWSVVKGFLAFEKDLETVAGITFYEHNETPGLGGEVDQPYFQKEFVGKKFFEQGKVLDFAIVKHGQPLNDHSVDGISGATMTSNGVMNFLNSDYRVYNKYFEPLRNK